MNLSLSQEFQKLVDDRVKSGRYATPEDVIAAALQTLEQQENLGDFATGGWDALVAEGEASTAEEGTLDGAEAFHRRSERRKRGR